MRKDLSSQISYLIVDTRQHELARQALARSQEIFPLDNRIVVSDREEGWDATSFVKIEPITSLREYSMFMVTEAWKYVTTEFCQVIQWDGFVMNAANFRSEFMDYDYIGAPWLHFETRRVGNGGFSLRSRKLMETVASLATRATDWEDWPEDMVICHLLADYLETLSMKFAPVDVAASYSMEETVPTSSPFGFHGTHLVPLMYSHDIEMFFSKLMPLNKPQLGLMQKGIMSMDDDAKTIFDAYLKKNDLSIPPEPF